MSSNMEMDDKIWKYLDNELDPEEKKNFESDLSKSKEMNVRLTELKSLNVLLTKNIKANLSEDFTRKVLQSISEIKFSPKRSHWLLFLGVFVTVIIAGLYISEFQSDIALKLNEIELPIPSNNISLNLDNTGEISLDKINQILLYILTFLSLIFFDRAILRPYFKGRR